MPSKNRNAAAIVQAYFDNPARFTLTDFERKFLAEAYMPSGHTRLSGEPLLEIFFPNLSRGSLSYKRWGILDKIQEQITASSINQSYTQPRIVGSSGDKIAVRVPDAVRYDESRTTNTVYTSDMNVAAAILCFGHECIKITADTAGRFEFAFSDNEEINIIIAGFQEHQVAVSPKAMAYNLKTLRMVIAQWYKN